jgi:hypothetical protein
MKEEIKMRKIQFSYWDESGDGALQINRRIAKMKVGLGNRSEREITIMEYTALKNGFCLGNKVRVINETV